MGSFRVQEDLRGQITRKTTDKDLSSDRGYVRRGFAVERVICDLIWKEYRVNRCKESIYGVSRNLNLMFNFNETSFELNLNRQLA